MNRNLVHENEVNYYVVSLVWSIIVYVMLIISMVGIIYILIGAVATFFINGLSIAYIRGNGVKLSENQFPEIHDRVAAMCRKMNIPQIPDVFVVQHYGILNAFATFFFGRNFIVIYSDIFELAKRNDNELDFVIAHELAHSHILSTHPPLPVRIKEVDRFFASFNQMPTIQAIPADSLQINS